MKRPNIVFVFADQLRYNAVGINGNSDVRTPNIDRVGAQGVTMDGVFSSCPICSPYRGQLVSGRYSHKNGVICNEYRLFDQTLIADRFKSHGYRTAYVGKWHMGYGPYTPEKRYGFDDMLAYNNGHSYYKISYWHNEKGPFRMVDYAPNVETDLACRYIREQTDANPDQPFCLLMSWGPPHWNFLGKERRYGDYPQEYALYDPDRIELPGNVPRQFAQFAREEIADYYGMTTSIDACLGRLVDQIDALGIGEDTVVCFTSDHGDHLNAHGMVTPGDRWADPSLTGSKATPFEESIHVPFVLRYPGRVPERRRSDTLFSSVDILPTLLGLSDLPIPEDIQGHDLSHALTGTEGEEPDSVFLQILGPGWPTRPEWLGLWRGLRTHDYVYARWHDRGGMRLLFDRKKDPLEMKNVVDDPDYAQTAETLERRLQRWLAETDDPFDNGERLPPTGILDLGQAFSHNHWLDNAPAEYAQAIRGNEERFRTGEKDYGPVIFNW